MNKPMKSLILVAAVLMSAALRPVLAVEVGQSAPDFTLTDIDGKKHSLSDYKGKTVILEWHNPDCPFVKKHYDSGNIPKLQQETTGEGVVWLTINSGAPGQQGADYSAGDLKEYFKKHNAAPTDYFRDQDGKVGHLYSAKTTPHLFIVNPEGKLVYQGGIDSKPSASKEDIAVATNYVREAMTALKAGKPIPNTSTKPYGCSVKYGSKS